MMRHYKFTIISMRKPPKKDINQQLKWLGSSLGLFNLRDKDKSCFRIFIELLKDAKNETESTSDELAKRADLSRATVIHHINKLIESGLVVNEKNKYMLRVDNTSDLIDEIEKDIERSLKTLREVAEDIDQKLGL